jgi:hypothetical protein
MIVSATMVMSRTLTAGARAGLQVHHARAGRGRLDRGRGFDRVGVPKVGPPESCFNSQFPSCWSQVFLWNCLSPIRLQLHDYVGLQTPDPAARDMSTVLST